MALGKMTISATQVAGNTSGATSAGFFAIQAGNAATAIADIATVNNAIVDDQQIIDVFKSVPNASTIQPGIIFTATTTDSGTSMTSFSVTSPSGVTIASVQPLMYVTGPGLSPGSRVLTATGTTITLDRAAIKGYVGGTFIVTGVPLNGGDIINNTLVIPNRGTLKLLPTDYVMIDNNGFPYLVPATSVGTNMPWNFA